MTELPHSHSTHWLALSLELGGGGDSGASHNKTIFGSKQNYCQQAGVLGGQGSLLGREIAHLPIRWWTEMEEGGSFRKPSLKGCNPCVG